MASEKPHCVRHTFGVGHQGFVLHIAAGSLADLGSIAPTSLLRGSLLFLHGNPQRLGNAEV